MRYPTPYTVQRFPQPMVWFCATPDSILHVDIHRGQNTYPSSLCTLVTDAHTVTLIALATIDAMNNSGHLLCAACLTNTTDGESQVITAHTLSRPDVTAVEVWAQYSSKDRAG